MTGSADRAIDKRNRLVWVVAIFLFVVGDGLTLQTRGPLLRTFEADFGVSEALLGLISPAGTLGFIVAVLVVGMVAGRIDVKRWMIVGIGLTAVSLLLMSGAPVYWLFLLFLVGQGTATGVVRGVDRMILSHLFPNHRGRVFTLYSLAWSIGAVMGPVFINTVLEAGNWRVAYVILGLFFLPLAGLVWQSDLPGTVAAERSLSLSGLRALLGRPIILGMMGAIALVGAAEGVIFTWLPFFASEFMPEAQANVLLTVFLIAYLPSRLLYSWLVDRTGSLPLAFGLSVCFVPAIWVALSGIDGLELFVAVFLAGFFTAGLFPLISAFGVDAAPSYSGPVSALSTGATYVGVAGGPLMVGLVAERIGILSAMLLTVFFAVGIAFILAVTWIVTYRA